MTFKVRINELAKRCYHLDGRLNRWGILFAVYCLVLNALVYKWVFVKLWQWLVKML